MRRFLIAGVAAAAILAAGVSAYAARTPARTHAANAQTLITRVDVKATEFKFVLSKKTAKRGVVIFKITNAGKLKHDFDIKGRKTNLISPGKTETLRISFLKKGHYPYKCTVPGHAAAGMKGVFTIT